MPTSITLRNVPDDIYARLHGVAASRHRSIDNEVIACLEQVRLPSRVCASEYLSRARALRGGLKDRQFSARNIAQAIEQGHP